MLQLSCDMKGKTHFFHQRSKFCEVTYRGYYLVSSLVIVPETLKKSKMNFNFCMTTMKCFVLLLDIVKQRINC